MQEASPAPLCQREAGNAYSPNAVNPLSGLSRGFMERDGSKTGEHGPCSQPAPFGQHWQPKLSQQSPAPGLQECQGKEQAAGSALGHGDCQ